MPAGAPEGNVNAEKWNLENGKQLFMDAIKLANKKTKDKKSFEHDFIGEVARELNTYHHVFTYLSGAYKELSPLHTELKALLEANCFYNTKKGNIKEATGIVNLKSNHQWTDRLDNTSKGEKVDIPIIKWVE